MADAGLWLDTVELRRHTGTRRPLALRAVLEDMEVGDTQVVGGVIDVDLVVEAVTEGVVVSGDARARWRGPCRRCLEPAEGEVVVDVHEVYEADATEGETWPLGDEGLDLAPMLRELTLLALPLSPLCEDDCVGPEPDRFPAGPDLGAAAADDEDAAGEPRDPRWAALDGLSFDE